MKNPLLAFAGIFLMLALAVHAETPVRSRIARQGADQVMISWDTVAGKSYIIKTTTQLGEPWETLATQPSTLVAATNTLAYNNIITGGSRFFQVVEIGDIGGMALIPAGSFQMGDTFNEGYSNELPVHTVYVSAFYMDKYEVTKALWDDVYQWAISHGYSFDYPCSGKAANHPVHSVNWYDCVKWCNARSEREGLTPAYYTSAAQTTVYRTGQVDVQNDWVKWNAGYRLPTEAEWEKAARDGASGHRFPWSDTDTISHSQANYYSYWAGGKPYYSYDISPTREYHPTYKVDGSPYTSPVGSFTPNGYGLFDMAGNVWEWCWDLYGSYSSGSQSDPRGPSSGSGRVFRGGCWLYFAGDCRSADRGGGGPGYGFIYFGFRSVLPPGQP